MNREQIDYIKRCRDTYHEDLLEQILPFWLKYGLDEVNGGVFTCLDRSGVLMDRTKSVWFQGRFAFVCSLAYNSIEKNSQWLAAAETTINFIEKHCFDSDGHMFFEVTAEGSPIRKRRYVFSECFAAIAFSEYAIASGKKEYAQKALDIFIRIQTMLGTPGFLQPKSTLEARSHSITMMLINVASCIRKSINDKRLDEQIDRSIVELQRYFMHPEYETLLEIVDLDGGVIDTCEGRTINPGHCIETAWFILEEARYRGWDRDLVKMGETIFNWAWKWGWDSEHKGIINFMDCQKFPNQNYSQDMKFWWPQCETIIATLYLYIATGNKKYIELHKEIQEYTFKHFPDREHGEWYGYLRRDGSVAQPAKGNIFKGPFHVPRMMILGELLCDEILESV